ncbi:MAG: hypothetical protein LBB55_06550 [Zoogloeaceae bacterium]|jgi:poly(3-hydroxybutyrate) depolymerase|nr:hypothetical protein [Zoogloeaceae bacterium]
MSAIGKPSFFNRFSRRLALLLGGLLAAVWFIWPGMKEARGADYLPRLNIDLRETTVSGISSGAFMAVQMGVAHSNSIKGVAATAGGPFFCAGEDSWNGAAVEKVIARCMQGDPQFPAMPITENELASMREATKQWAAEGLVDPLESLARQKVWIFHGYNDGIVKAPVSEALRDYYRQFLPAHQVFYKHELPAAHAQISAACVADKKKGASCNTCSVTGSPFINTCAVGKTPYDAAGSALQFFYGPLRRVASHQLQGEILTFSQARYTLRDGEEIEPGKISLAEEGYLYLPRACKEGKACRLHIAFHGCQQYAAKIGLDFVKSAGFNEWAEQNRLVVLFPQAASSFFSPANPNGCWDWWGYNDTGDKQAGNYLTQQGLQTAAIWRMAQALASAASLEIDAVEDFVPGGAQQAVDSENEAQTAEATEATDKTGTPAPAREPAKKQRFVPSLVPPLVTLLDASSDQILLAWKPVEGAAAYRVYRLQPAAEKGGKSSFALISPEDFADTAYVDSGLEAERSYRYKVTALNAEGKETAGQPLTFRTRAREPECDPYFSMLGGRVVDKNGQPTDRVCR